VFNSFVSDLTDVPRKGARVKQMLRDFSSHSIKDQMYDISSDKSPSNLKMLQQTPHYRYSDKLPQSQENSINELNHIEVSNQLK